MHYLPLRRMQGKNEYVILALAALLSLGVIVVATVTTTVILTMAQTPPPAFNKTMEKMNDRFGHPLIARLAAGGIKAFDQNVKELEEELGTNFSKPLEDDLRSQVELELNETTGAGGTN